MLFYLPFTEPVENVTDKAECYTGDIKNQTVTNDNARPNRHHRSQDKPEADTSHYHLVCPLTFGYLPNSLYDILKLDKITGAW